MRFLSRSVLPLSIRWLVLALLAAIVLPVALFALQADSTSTGTANGPAGDILNFLSPYIKIGLTSGLMYVVNKGLGILSGWSALAKNIVLGIFGILVSYAGELLHYVISKDPTTWGSATVEGLVGAATGSLIYYLGKIGTRTPS